MRGRLLALSMVSAIVLPASSALASSGGIGIRLIDAPAGPGGGLARSYIVDRLVPGASRRRRVEISNTTRSIADVAIYPAAANLARGNFRFAPGRTANELAGWTSVTRTVLHLAPGGKAVETVTIDVPTDASAGERYAVVWAALSAPVAGGVTLVNRVGVRMYVSIGPGGPPASQFVIGSFATARSVSGAPLVAARVHNTGARTLEITGTLALTKGPGGLRAGPFPVEGVRMLGPGDSKLVIVRLDKRLPRGPWRAYMRLSSGRIHRAVAATISFPSLKPTAAGVVPRSAIFVAILVTVLLASLACAFLLARRRPL